MENCRLENRKKSAENFVPGWGLGALLQSAVAKAVLHALYLVTNTSSVSAFWSLLEHVPRGMNARIRLKWGPIYNSTKGKHRL